MRKAKHIRIDLVEFYYQRMILGGSNMPTVILTEAAAYEVKDMLASNDMSDGYLKIK